MRNVRQALRAEWSKTGELVRWPQPLANRLGRNYGRSGDVGASLEGEGQDNGRSGDVGVPQVA
ncbi:hypothetical protein AMQ83_08405 [Paenibacillus riograndensis]|nr:hypothetical protein AMQ83_08405 [Paenibacillus riograndensis]